VAVTTDEIRTRRSVIAAALGGVGVYVAQALGRPQQADAANGDTVKVGQTKTGSALTQISSSSSGFKGTTTGSGTSGLIGQSSSGTGFGVNGINLATSGTPVGVRGSSTGNGIGVYGFAARGVVGEANGTSGIGVVAKSTATSGTPNGLRASSLAPNSDAIIAENSTISSGTGTAIRGRSSNFECIFGENVSDPLSVPRSTGVLGKGPQFGVEGHGVRLGVFGHADDLLNDVPSVPGTLKAGVRGSANGASHTGGSFENFNALGMALHAKGGLKIESACGVATIAAGTDSITVTPTVKVTANSVVLANLQSSPGNAALLRLVAPGNNQFTVFLNAQATNNTTVGWLVISER
jgi:hypothetical protein